MSRHIHRSKSTHQDESQKKHLNDSAHQSHRFDTAALGSVLPSIMVNPRSASPAAILQMQQAGGNAAVTRMMSSRSQPPTVQTKKLTVGPTSDKYEQEADQVSKAVASGQMVNQPVQRAPQIIQRKGFFKKAKKKLMKWGGKAKAGMALTAATGSSAMAGALKTIKPGQALHKSNKSLKQLSKLATRGKPNESLDEEEKKKRRWVIFNTATNIMMVTGGTMAVVGVATANPLLIGAGLGVVALGGLLKFGGRAYRKIRNRRRKVKTNPDNPGGAKITGREYKKKKRKSIIQQFYDLLPATGDLGDLKAHKRLKKAKQPALKIGQTTTDNLNHETGEQDDKVSPLKHFLAAGLHIKDIQNLGQQKQQASASTGEIAAKESQLDSKEAELQGNPAGTGGKEQELATKRQEISTAKRNLTAKKRQIKQKVNQKSQKQKELEKAQNQGNSDAGVIEKLQGEINTLDGELDALNKEVDTLKNTTIPQLKQALETIVDEIDILTNEIKALEKAVEELQKPENKIKAQLAKRLRKR